MVASVAGASIYFHDHRFAVLKVRYKNIEKLVSNFIHKSLFFAMVMILSE